MQQREEKPESDVHVQHEGTISLFHLQNEEAKGWVETHVVGETSWFGQALAVEHRYVLDLIQGMQEDGLIVEVYK
jgi:hypothetical protein